MKTKRLLPLIMALVLTAVNSGFAQQIKIKDNWGKQGITKSTDNLQGTTFTYSLSEYTLNDVQVEGQLMKSIVVPGVFLPNEEGAPDLPFYSRYIAVPDGATVSVRILSSRTETMHNVRIAPAPRIPLDTDDSPLLYQKDAKIYNIDAFYPASPVTVSGKRELRGIPVVGISIVPFQYNPVTKDLVVYKDMEIQITFEGGSGNVGNSKMRSRFWDPVISSQIINSGIIPNVDFDDRKALDSKGGECEYLIITPNNTDFLAWADSIKNFRTLQGIETKVVTTAEIGGNTVAAIESYVDNAYYNWSKAPAAVLLLGDFDTLPGSTTGIASQMFVHPAGYPNFPSDNHFADVNGDDLPDIVFARITANNAEQLSTMVGKFLDYERKPPTDASFYNTPITALGWQTTRWFQLCSEVVAGFMKNSLGKSPIRINALYSGAPETDPWSTASNTSTLLNYFGPSGLKYIPATPQEVGGFTGGTATDIVNAVNNGSFMLVHRDHGYYGGWGEPAFNTTSIGYLTNVNNKLPFVFSINCQTGAFQRATESFAEKFHRYTYNGQKSGALGLIAATEVSYSFVNDAYLWGVFDNMFPQFMPDRTDAFPMSYVMPAFASASGKYFLGESGWVGSSAKVITYRLFHHHGDAFLTLYTEVPKALTVAHASSLASGAASFSVSANAGSIIALVSGGQILATAQGTGSPVAMAIPPLSEGSKMTVTITKQNYFRYSVTIPVGAGTLSAEFSGTPNVVAAGNKVTFTDLSSSTPTAWSWSFPGGTPATSSVKNPVVTYPTAGSYDVSLTVSDGTQTSSKNKVKYVIVNSGAPVVGFSVSNTSVIAGQAVTFTDLSSNSPTSWSWSFAGGTPSASTLQNPTVTYSTAGTYSVTLTASNASGSGTLTQTGLVTVRNAAPVAAFSGSPTTITVNGTVNFTDLSVNTPTSWLWTFEGGTPASSTTQNPSVTYAAAGTYAVVLTVANASGSSTLSKAGYITVGVSSPVADFTSDITRVLSGGAVNFTDLSTGSPVSWSWSFPGGNPSSSSLQNPSVIYTVDGTYDVTLVAANAGGESTKSVGGYITVWNGVVTYCTSSSVSTATEWIAQVGLGTFTKKSGPANYSDNTNPPISVNPGASLSLSLTPGFSAKFKREMWKVWIDYNQDGDFDDANENVFSGSSQKSTIYGTITIPATASGQARMRVSMRYNTYPSPCGTFDKGEVEDYLLSFSADAMSPVETPDQQAVKIYPNPVSNYLHVQTKAEQSQAYLFSLSGKMVRHQVIGSQDIIDVYDLPKGVYFLRLISNGEIRNEKIVKQ